MSTKITQAPGGDGEPPVWKRRDISSVRRELYLEFAVVQSAFSVASVSKERAVLIRANDAANKFQKLLNEKIAQYNACVIDDVSAEHAANDLMVDISAYRAELDTSLKPLYIEETGEGEREVSFDAGSPIAKEEAPERAAPSRFERLKKPPGGGIMDKTMRISESEEEESPNEEEAPNEEGIPNGEEEEGGVEDPDLVEEANDAEEQRDNAGENQITETAATGGIISRIAGMFRGSSTPQQTNTAETVAASAGNPTIHVIPATPAERTPSMRSAGSIARSIQAKKERDDEQKKEKERMETNRRQSEAEEAEALRKVEEIRRQREQAEKLHRIKVRGIERIHQEQQQAISDDDEALGAREAMKRLEQSVNGGEERVLDPNAAVENWAKNNASGSGPTTPVRGKMPQQRKGEKKVALKLDLDKIQLTPKAVTKPIIPPAKAVKKPIVPSVKPKKVNKPTIQKLPPREIKQKEEKKGAENLREKKERIEKETMELMAKLQELHNSAQQVEEGLEKEEEKEEEEEEEEEEVPITPTTPSCAGSASQEEFVKVQIQMFAMAQLKEARPVKKFAGVGKGMSFAKHMLKFETALEIVGLSDKAKLNEFQHYFEGAAFQLIEAETLEKTNVGKAVETAIEKLTKKFGLRKESAMEMLEELLQGKQVGEKDHSGLLMFYCKLRSIHTLAKNTGRGAEFENKMIIESILAKKTPHLTAKWSKRVVKNMMSEGEMLSFDTFLEFLDTEHTIAELCYKNSGQAQNARPVGAAKVAATTATTPAKNTSRTTAGATTATTAAAASATGGCERCGGQHRLPACDVFKGLTSADKRKFCINTRICYMCLGAGHMARNCSATEMCAICGVGHHTLLHPDESSGAPPTSAGTNGGGGGGGAGGGNA